MLSDAVIDIVLILYVYLVMLVLHLANAMLLHVLGVLWLECHSLLMKLLITLYFLFIWLVIVLILVRLLIVNDLLFHK